MFHQTEQDVGLRFMGLTLSDNLSSSRAMEFHGPTMYSNSQFLSWTQKLHVSSCGLKIRANLSAIL